MEEHKDPEEEQEYSFLKETIKDEGLKNKLKRDVLRMSWLGLIFGVIASFSFSAFHPLMKSMFKSDPQEVTIPEEEEEEDQGEQKEEEEAASPVLDVQSYRELQKSLAGVAQTANKSVVEIVGISGDKDWVTESYDSRNSVTGVIIADNGQELLILGKTSVMDEAEEIQVEFCDGSTCQTSLKKMDRNLGLGIYSVARPSISDSTWTQIQIATLGSSRSLVGGDTIIALGNPFGYGEAMGFGTVSSAKNYRTVADGRYQLLCTDIAGAADGTGVLVNLNGEIVGLVDQSISDEESMELVTGYGITDLKKEIEYLSNGESVPYIGIFGIDVTDEVEEQGVPAGVYVKEVEADSPAMKAGIQSGDVITKIGDKEISTLAAYHTALLELNAGSKVKLAGMRQGSGGYVDVDFSVTVGSKE